MGDLKSSQALSLLAPLSTARDAVQGDAGALVGSVPTRARARDRSFALCFVIAASLFSCTSKTSAVTILGPGIINNPKNKSLRVDILKFGLSNFCSEMMTRGVALKLSDDHPVAGRFFGRDCRSDVLDDESKATFNVKFAGIGYVWANITQRVGFEVLGSVELFPDFQIANDKSMYVYFRARRVETTQMKIVLVEVERCPRGGKPGRHGPGSNRACDIRSPDRPRVHGDSRRQ